MEQWLPDKATLQHPDREEVEGRMGQNLISATPWSCSRVYFFIKFYSSFFYRVPEELVHVFLHPSLMATIKVKGILICFWFLLQREERDFVPGEYFYKHVSFPLAWEKQAAGLTGQQAALNNCLLHPKKSRVLRWHFRAGGRHQGVVQLKALFCFLWGHVNGKTLIFAFPFPFGPHCLRAQSGDNFAAHLCLLWVSALLAMCCAFPFLALAQWEGKAG